MKHLKFYKGISLIIFIFYSSISFSQIDTTIVKFKNPSSVNIPKGYSQTAVIDLGNCQMIILSGQVAFDNQGKLVGQGDLSKQAEQVFLNIKNILTDLGGTMNNLVKLGIYMTDVSQIQTIRNVRDEFINVKNPPTSTLLQVNKLFRDDVLLEIEATAIITKK